MKKKLTRKRPKFLKNRNDLRKIRKKLEMKKRKKNKEETYQKKIQIPKDL